MESAVSDGGTGSTLGAGDTVVSTKGVRVKLRGPIGDPWSHGEKHKVNGWSCGYCTARKDSGGVTRFRNHLAGLQGDVISCPNVPRFVRAIMLNKRAEGIKRRSDTKQHRLYVEKAIMEEAYADHRRSNIPRDEAGQVEWAVRESLRDFRSSGNSPPVGMSSGSSPPVRMSSGSSPPFGRASNRTPPFGRASCSSNQSTMDRFYRSPSVSQAPFDIDLALGKAPIQRRVDSMLPGSDAKARLGKALAKWFHSDDILGRKADNPYFIAAIKIAQQGGEGVPIPKGREIDGPLLDMNYDDLQAEMENHKENWGEYGITVMCDSWTGPTKMCIINFMIFCNGRMFFHKTVNATGHVQNADFIYSCIKEVVVEEIGAKSVIQIVTDNGSNYKKACKQLTTEYPHITWQPCGAHTINLMLKDITRFPEVESVVVSAKRICNYMYNHNRLHAMMREKIGGELIRWNATRFGTVFLFLQSFLDRKDKFQAWIVSSDWRDNELRDDPDHTFTYDCLTSRHWWEDVQLVLKAVTPLYTVLRFADQQKNGTISGFIPRMVNAQSEIFAKLKHDERVPTELLHRMNEVINRRTRYLLNNTLMLAAAALDPAMLYTSNVVKHHSATLAVALAFNKIASSPMEASKAGDQYTKVFLKKGSLFGLPAARSSALRVESSAADWWNLYGGQCKELQRLAKLIVSQCMSSSGCERNWSTFALVHTKLRNRLGYEKLHKLVYVHYNLKLAMQQFGADYHSLQMEVDPCSMMMDVALFDDTNPIMEWLSNSMTESPPILDEYDDSDDDWTTPGGFLIDELQMKPTEVAAFKRKLCFSKKGGKKKGKVGLEEEEFADDYESDSTHGSPVYAESADSSSASDDAGDGVDDVGGDGSGGEVAKKHGDRASGSRAHGGAPRHSSVRIGKPTCSIRPRSTRKRKPTLKNISEL